MSLLFREKLHQFGGGRPLVLVAVGGQNAGMSANRLELGVVSHSVAGRYGLVRLGAGALLGAVVASIVTVAGCRGDDLFFDCEDQEAAFREVAESEGQLLDPIPNGEPYPVALKFSELGINRLLEGVVGADVPFTGELPFVWFSGPGTLHFTQTSDPVIELEALEGCPTCVQYTFDFNVVFYGADGEPDGAGIGNVSFRIPIELEPDGDSATLLIADYSRLRVQKLWMSAFGLDSEEHEALVDAVGLFMQDKIQENYDPVELLRLDSWQIGNGDVRLLARKLYVFPEEDTLALGMQSNLPLPPGGGLEITGEMPMGVPMVVDFDISMFEAMVEHLLDTDEIARVYDEDGNADPDGNYGVTIDSIQGAPNGQEFMTTVFKVWRFAEGYCGYAVAQMDLNVEATEAGITLEAGEVVVIDGMGSGAVAADEQQLVDDNQQVVEQFKTGVSDNLATTINYDALNIEGSAIVFETLAADVDIDHLETWIDFVVVESP